MRKEDIEHIVDETLSQLKDFQRMTVDNVYHRLYVEGQKKHLVADEVGLGKTIVAKGLIAKALHDQISSGEDDQFKVVYICSNQALAAQNLRKLNILKDTGNSRTEVGRLIFQAFKDDNDSVFKLTSLTPTTSFRLIRGSGLKDERLLMYSVLSECDHFKTGNRLEGLKLSLIGYVDNIDDWLRDCDSYKERNQSRIRDEVFERFPQAIENTILSKKDYAYIYEQIGLEEESNLLNILIAYSVRLTPSYKIVKKELNYHVYLLSVLRLLLTEICLDFIDADLYILDEFQRFNDLIDTEGKSLNELTEAAAIAKKIFAKDGSKVLMLSATPFKQYSTRAEEDNNEEHYREFVMVLRFLLEDEELVQRFQSNRKLFFELLRRPEMIAFDDSKKLENQLISKIELEELYRKVMSRTERLIVSDDKNTLVKDKFSVDRNKNSLKLQPQDLVDFIKADQLIRALSEANDKKVSSILGYVLSSPYPFSFLDRYKVKEILKNHKKNPIVSRAIRESKDGWLDWDKILNYKEIKNVPNGKLRFLMEDTFQNDLCKRLWLNPSLTYYRPEGAFESSVNDSKTLLFSKWVMVPKMVASILSYETERLTIGDKGSYRSNEEPRVYSPPKKFGKTKREPRRPTKILAMKMKDGKSATMSAFTILYPSLTFALDQELNPANYLEQNLSLKEIKAKMRERIQQLIDNANLEQFTSSNPDSRKWYWAAPVLLDKIIHKEETELSIQSVGEKTSKFINSSIGDDEDDTEEFESATTGKHFEELKELFNRSEEADLGAMPHDLAEVLTEIVLGSPAVSFLRTLHHYFTDEHVKIKFVYSLDTAMEFYRLFDKPESIATLSLTCPGDQYYWRQVLYYCASGNIQSMLDEYGHLIIGDAKTMEQFVHRIATTINFNTSSVKVDSARSFLRNEELRMRCHFAVDFGNQDMDDEKGRKRIANVLDNFNSPFRPFVLASTSIGQEGLDFHYYCRKIVHWNLPSNPIDFEQREGRINRYKGLVIRQNIVKKYRSNLTSDIKDYWVKLFSIAREREGEGARNKPQLVPYWHVESDDIHIERIAPILPYSKEVNQLKHLIASLTLYRLTFGQPRQEELVESMFKHLNQDQIDFIREKFMFDLSPINYQNHNA
jgi:hypothetical protein